MAKTHVDPESCGNLCQRDRPHAIIRVSRHPVLTIWNYLVTKIIARTPHHSTVRLSSAPRRTGDRTGSFFKRGEVIPLFGAASRVDFLHKI